MTTPVLLTVELRIEGSAISGSALDGTGQREHFGGWLELIALVHRAAGGSQRSGVVSGVDPDDPARRTGHDGPDPAHHQPAHHQGDQP